MQQTLVWIGLGSNLGERITFLQRALDMLQQDNRLQLINTSSIYETEPLGFESDQPFLNAVATIIWTGNAEELLKLIATTETSLGRTRNDEIRYESRCIDLDILFFGEEVINNSTLQVPHPRIHERQFVLQPLNELIPSYIHPVLNQSVSELVHFCKDKSKVFIHAKPLSVNH